MLAEFVNQALALHKTGKPENLHKAIGMYNQALNIEPVNNSLRFLLSDALMRIEWNGLAANVLHNMLSESPENSEAWCNLGAAYRKENHNDLAKKCWERSLELKGDSVEVCNNMASLYADSGKPAEAMAWLDRSLKIADTSEARYQRSLALLTLGDFDAGWPLYEARREFERFDNRRSIDVPIWTGEETDHLYVHGEQGVGDEIMFLSCLDEVRAKRITLELNRKVMAIAKQTWPHVNVIEKAEPGDYTAKIPIASLATMFRRKWSDFPGKPYLKPDPEMVDFYRKELAEMGPGPYVALTWIGGIKHTRVASRSVPPTMLKPFLDRYTCVNAQYNDGNPMTDIQAGEMGLKKIDEGSAGGDLADQAALFKAVDAVVTVQQTAVHVAGAVGTPCHVLLAHNPQWRYLQTGDRLPWYDSVKLYRKQEGGEWPIEAILKALEGQFANH